MASNFISSFVRKTCLRMMDEGRISYALEYALKYYEAGKMTDADFNVISEAYDAWLDAQEAAREAAEAEDEPLLSEAE